MLITKTVSSLTKIYPDIVNGERITTATLLQNETFSFQIAFKNETSVDSVLPMYIRVETDLDTKFISEYLEGYVPVANGDFPNSDDYFERKTAGLYPDMLLKRTTNAQVRFVEE